MHYHPSDSHTNYGEIQVILDGLPVELPSNRRSLAAIRCYLETLAMKHQRLLYSLIVDDQLINLAQLPANLRAFTHVEAESIELDAMPLQLIKNARQQTMSVRDHVESAVALVLINDRRLALEYWWNLARMLKEPLLTLSLLPDNLCGPANGSASPTQLRKWQLQQLATIIRSVDDACESDDTIKLSNALENRVLPWLDKLHELICLWEETASAGLRLAA